MIWQRRKGKGTRKSLGVRCTKVAKGFEKSQRATNLHDERRSGRYPRIAAILVRLIGYRWNSKNKGGVGHSQVMSKGGNARKRKKTKRAHVGQSGEAAVGVTVIGSINDWGF